MPALRKRLGAGASDEQLLLHAFYDDALATGLQAPPTGLRTRTTPLTELVAHLSQRRDIRQARVRVGGVDLSFTA
jgi:hypothetical protein